MPKNTSFFLVVFFLPCKICRCIMTEASSGGKSSMAAREGGREGERRNWQAHLSHLLSQFQSWAAGTLASKHSKVVSTFLTAQRALHARCAIYGIIAAVNNKLAKFPSM